MSENAKSAEKTDEELVSLSLKDQEYFGCLVSRYEEKMLRYIRRISGVNVQNAEDILQDIFIKVYRNLNDFDQDLKFSSWLYRIAHNQVISEFRKKQARPQLIGGEDIENFIHSVASTINIANETDEKILRSQVEKILEKIDLKYREALVLHYLEGKNYQEISDILRKPMGTVATLINRAKKNFKKETHNMNISF